MILGGLLECKLAILRGKWEFAIEKIKKIFCYSDIGRQ